MKESLHCRIYKHRKILVFAYSILLGLWGHSEECWDTASLEEFKLINFTGIDYSLMWERRFTKILVLQIGKMLK